MAVLLTNCGSDDDTFTPPPSAADFGSLDTLATGLDNPWGLVLMGDKMVFTDRDGRFLFWDGQAVSELALSIPRFQQIGQGGLLDLELYQIGGQDYLYFTHTGTRAGGMATFLARAQWDAAGPSMSNYELLYEGNSAASTGHHFGSRIAFDESGHLYFSIGDRGQREEAQNPQNNFGTILRLNMDGSIPGDNPFVGSADTLDEIWSYGHRNPQGLVYCESNGEMWSHEHGPKGGDELNQIFAGANYAWPLATYGRNYDGSIITEDTSYPGTIDPVHHWTPSIAPCGMACMALPGGGLEIFVGALAGQQLLRMEIQNGELVKKETLLEDYARFRALELAPNGDLYILTEGPGMLLRWQRDG